MLRPSLSLVLSLLVIFQTQSIFAINSKEKLKNYIVQVKEFSLKENNIPEFIDFLMETRKFLLGLNFEESYELKTKNIKDEITQLIRISQKGSLEKIILAHEAFVRNNGGGEEGGLWDTVMSWLKNPYVLGGIGIVSAITLWWAFGDQIKSFFGFSSSSGQENDEGTKNTEKNNGQEVPSNELRHYVKSWVEQNIKDGTVEKIMEKSSFNYGDNVLIWAARHGFIDIVKLLVPHAKEKINYGNYSWQTPLMLAAYNGYLEIVKILLNSEYIKDGINAKDKDQKTALIYAASMLRIEEKNNYFFITKELISNKYLKKGINIVAKDGSFALMYLCTNFEIFKEALKSKYLNLNVQNHKGRTILMYAAENGYIKIVNELLKDERANSQFANLQDQDGHTALMLASFMGRSKIVKMLLESDLLVQGEINEYNSKFGETSLMLAAALGGHHQTVQELLSSKKYMNNSSVNELERQDKEGRTPLIFAANANFINMKTLKILLESPYMNEKIFKMKDNKGHTAFLKVADTVPARHHYTDDNINVFLKNKKYMDKKVFQMKDKKGNTVVMLAAKYYNFDMLSVLLKNSYLDKKMFHQQNYEGKTALMIAASTDRLSAGIIVEELLNHHYMNQNGFKVLDQNGNTALMLAVRSGFLGINLFLNNKFMNKSIFNIQNKKGETALILAASVMYDPVKGPSNERLINNLKSMLDSKYLSKEGIKLTNKAGETAYEVANKNWHYKRAALIEATEKIFEDISKFSGEE